jgi:hypothetical protein
MSGLQFNNQTDFNRTNIQTSGKDDNNVVILEGRNTTPSTSSLRSETKRPQFSNERFESNTRVKIKPNLNTFDFASMANPKRNSDNSDGERQSDEEDIDFSDGNSDEDMENINMPNFADTNMEQNLNTVDDDDDDDDSDGEEVSSSEGSAGVNNVEYDAEDEYMPQEETVTKKSDKFPDIAPKNYRETTKLKQELLYNLARLEKSGYELSKRLTMASSYDDLLFEYRRLKKQRDVESSVKFYRKILMLVVSGTEKLNDKFDPLDIKLNGWSENVMENINDYDEVFEELHDKYSDAVQMMPELKLLLMVVGSGFMFHLTNSLFKTVEPDLGDLIRNNPDIAKSISKDAMSKISEKLGTGNNDPLMNMVKTGVNMKNNSSRTRENRRTFDVRRPTRTAGARPNLSNSDMESVDNILNSLENGPVQTKNIQSGVRLNL